MIDQMMQAQFMAKYQPGAKSMQFLPGENMDFGFIGGNRFGRYKKISSEETINMIINLSNNIYPRTE